ncbi:hypothetical protein ACFLZG_00765 [Thermodesulfobacteriota bacterium]
MKRPVRTRKPGVVGRGREKLPFTRFGKAVVTNSVKNEDPHYFVPGEVAMEPPPPLCGPLSLVFWVKA